MKPKHIHFIGICGVAMSALAIAFQKAGYTVTGSDAGFFPPVSDNLENNKINFYPGWHLEKMIANGKPDLVVVGNVASSTNPEWVYVQKNNLEYLSYPEAIAKFFVKPNSIVCAGTYGKTTTSALLAWILTQNGYNPNYMFGGLAIDNDFDSASLGCHSREGGNPQSPSANLDSRLRGNDNKGWSVLEGDEYKTARWDNSPKFSHYYPTHLLLTAVKWDHADVYPTEDSYVEAFKNLTKSIPKNGLVVVSEKISNDIVSLFHCFIFKYGQSDKNDYNYSNIKQSKSGLEFDIIIKRNDTTFKTSEAMQQAKRYNIQTSMLGDFMAENITACFALACEIGIEPKKIIGAIKNFKGLKRRLEKKGTLNGVDIYDDIAHSPEKAKATLSTLKYIYGCHSRESGNDNSKIWAIFESNTGNRKKQAIEGYKNAFKDADEVIIPRLTKIKTDKNEIDLPMDGQELVNVISQTHHNTKYIDDDEKLINYLKEKTQPNDVIVFMGSHGFRGMIEKMF